MAKTREHAVGMHDDGTLGAAGRAHATTPAAVRISGGTVDLVAGILLTGIATWFIVQALGFEEADHTGVGPATFPMGIAVLLTICALLLAARGALTLAGQMTSQTLTIGRPLSVGLGMALVIAFPALMTTLGYFIATALWMPGLLLVAGYRKPIGILLVTLGFLVFAKVAFEMILGVRLP